MLTVTRALPVGWLSWAALLVLWCSCVQACQTEWLVLRACCCEGWLPLLLLLLQARAVCFAVLQLLQLLLPYACCAVV